MTHRYAALFAALALLILVAGGAPRAQDADAPIPVGEFLVKVATALGLPAPAGGFTPQNAGAILGSAGIVVQTDPAAPLTEADAVKVMTDLGYRVVTGTPSRTVSAARADLLVKTFIVPPGPSAMEGAPAPPAGDPTPKR